MGNAPFTHCVGGWFGPTAVLDAVVKRKIPNNGDDDDDDVKLSSYVNSMWFLLLIPLAYFMHRLCQKRNIVT
jgi:hypothetical protein